VNCLNHFLLADPPAGKRKREEQVMKMAELGIHGVPAVSVLLGNRFENYMYKSA